MERVARRVRREQKSWCNRFYGAATVTHLSQRFVLLLRMGWYTCEPGRGAIDMEIPVLRYTIAVL